MPNYNVLYRDHYSQEPDFIFWLVENCLTTYLIHSLHEDYMSYLSGMAPDSRDYKLVRAKILEASVTLEKQKPRTKPKKPPKPPISNSEIVDFHEKLKNLPHED